MTLQPAGIYPYWLRPLPLVILLGMAQLAVALLHNHPALTQDEAMWHYIGRNWFRHGLVPYTGGVDNKSPLFFAVFGLSDMIDGVNYWFPRVLGTVIQCTGIYFLYKLTVLLTGQRLTGIVALTLYGLSLLWKSTGGKYVSFTETYSITLLLTAIYYFLASVRTPMFFVAGCLAGLALAFRLTAVFGSTVLLISSIRKKKQAAVWFAGGTVISFLAVCGILALAGIPAQEMWLYGFTDNFSEGSTTDHPAAWKLESFISHFFYSELLLFYPALVLYFFIPGRRAFLLLWLLAELAGIVLIGTYAFPHFKSLLPPLCIITACSLVYVTGTARITVKQLVVAIWILFFPKTIEPVYGFKKLVSKPVVSPMDSCDSTTVQAGADTEKQLGTWIRNNTTLHDTVLVAGYGAKVQVYSERIAPSIIFNVTQTPPARKRFLDDLAFRRPCLVAIPVFSAYREWVRADIRQQVSALVKTGYINTGCRYGYTIYRKQTEL